MYSTRHNVRCYNTPEQMALLAKGMEGKHLHPKPLKADMKGQFHIVVGGGLRLYFEPDHSPLPTVNDGGLDRKKVTAIKILEVDDKH